MTITVSIDQAQAKLAEIIASLAPGDEVVITRDRQPVARLVILPKPPQRRQPWRCKGMITLVVEDDEHLEGFQQYMP